MEDENYCNTNKNYYNSGGENMKKFILIILIGLWSLPEAGLLSNFFKNSAPSDSARFELKPLIMLSWYEISSINGQWYTSKLAGKGFGIMLERTKKKDGENYAVCSVSLVGIFDPIIPAQEFTKFSGGISLNVLNNYVGLGMKFNGKFFTGLLCSNLDITTLKLW
jgi:hypothetical protein